MPHSAPDLQFYVTLSGPAIDTPSSPGVDFAFSLYDGTGTTPLLTSAPDGTLASVEADSSGIAPSTNNASVANATVAPEPTTWLLVLALPIGAAIRKWRQSPAYSR